MEEEAIVVRKNVKIFHGKVDAREADVTLRNSHTNCDAEAVTEKDVQAPDVKIADVMNVKRMKLQQYKFTCTAAKEPSKISIREVLTDELAQYAPEFEKDNIKDASGLMKLSDEEFSDNYGMPKEHVRKVRQKLLEIEVAANRDMVRNVEVHGNANDATVLEAVTRVGQRVPELTQHLETANRLLPLATSAFPQDSPNENELQLPFENVEITKHQQSADGKTVERRITCEVKNHGSGLGVQRFVHHRAYGHGPGHRRPRSVGSTEDITSNGIAAALGTALKGLSQLCVPPPGGAGGVATAQAPGEMRSRSKDFAKDMKRLKKSRSLSPQKQWAGSINAHL